MLTKSAPMVDLLASQAGKVSRKRLKKQKAKKDKDEGRLEKSKDQGRGNRKHYTKVKN